MSESALTVTETGEVVVARFANRKLLNDQTLEPVGEELFRLASMLHGRRLVLDFANVEYLQSSVIGKLITLSKKVAAVGGRLIITNMHPKVHGVFTLTKLDRVFEIETLQTEADSDSAETKPGEAP